MTVRILTGDCRDVLRTLESDSVDCVITSPPYWGLRDYGTATWEGGDPECEHVGSDARTVSGGAGKQYTNAGSNRVYSGDCRCGASRVDSQIGLESDFNAYVEKMVSVFGEVRRVLRKDGTLWLNLGDSYNGYMANQRGTGLEVNRQQSRKYIEPGAGLRTSALKAKDLVGIPWRVAFALQADGWYLRQEVIWHKPNPMPESVTDRCTRAHESLFLLAKSERYHYDAAAIAEPLDRPDEATRQTPARFGGADKFTEASKQSRLHSGNEYTGTPNGTRNKRSVWTIATQPYKESHFATFPPALVEPCILAGCPVGGTILDPFGGAGTVGLVADRLERNAILIELNPAYADMAAKRVANDCPMFASVDSESPPAKMRG